MLYIQVFNKTIQDPRSRSPFRIPVQGRAHAEQVNRPFSRNLLTFLSNLVDPVKIPEALITF